MGRNQKFGLSPLESVDRDLLKNRNYNTTVVIYRKRRVLYRYNDRIDRLG